MAIESIGIIGIGVIGETLLASSLQQGISPEQISVAEKSSEKKVEVCKTYGVRDLSITNDLDTLFIAVKPQDFFTTLEEWGLLIGKTKLIVSFAAGIKIDSIKDFIGHDSQVTRVMPNTAMTVGRGMSAVSFSQNVDKSNRDWIVSFLKQVGQVIVIDENLQDAVTATSGSGPAYFFEFAESMLDAAISMGIDPVDANTLVKETLVGAALMVDRSGKELDTLRRQVTSPNGTTAAALEVFDKFHLREMVKQAMYAARERSYQLSK